MRCSRSRRRLSAALVGGGAEAGATGREPTRATVGREARFCASDWGSGGGFWVGFRVGFGFSFSFWFGVGVGFGFAVAVGGFAFWVSLSRACGLRSEV